MTTPSVSVRHYSDDQHLSSRVPSAPAIFQHEMENLLQDCLGVLASFNGGRCWREVLGLMTGLSDEDHSRNLGTWLRDAGLKLKLYKCVFRVKRAGYLGFYN